MKCGIIGLPQVGKTSLFRTLTHAPAEDSHRHADVQHVGVAPVPDLRLDRLVELFSPAKVTRASVEYVDVSAIGQDALKETGYLSNLRTMDALMHVVRIFADDRVAHAKGSLDPQRDASNVDLDLVLSDLGVIENRIGKLERDIKKMSSPALEREYALLDKARKWLDTGKPLREADWTDAEKRELKGFAFLSQKPMLLVLNVAEDDAGRIPEILRTAGFDPAALPTNTMVTGVSAKLEAELALMPEAEAAEFAKSFGLAESGMVRLTRATFELLGLIVFFTVGEKECRAWSIPRGSTALEAAGSIHSDFEKHFIRAEVVAWDKLLEAGSLAAARQKGSLRLEGKEYVLQDGEICHIRHSG